MAGIGRATRELEPIRLFAQLHLWGLVGAFVFYISALTPSLLPRTWFYQAVISGWAAGIGYLLGLGAHWVFVRYLRDRFPRLNAETWPPIVQVWVRRAVFAVGGAWVLAVLWFSKHWQDKLAAAANTTPLRVWEFVLIAPVSVIIFSLVLLVARSLRWSANWVDAHATHRLKPRARGVMAWALVLVVAVWFVHTALPGAIVGAGERFYTAQNRNPDPQMQAPTQPERSGSPDSEVDFNGVGFYGSRFVSEGATASQLEAVTGRLSKEPIRVYAGLGNAPDVSQRAQLLIDELERTHAQDRKAMLLLMTTGTGWVSDYATQGFELLYDGDTAIAAGQYSAMPSALNFLGGGETVRQAGWQLLDPIISWWNGLPADHRPKLYLYGESLGTTGVEAAFSGLRDIVNSVDGILLTGPPYFNTLRTQLVTRRDPGSTETAPVYSDGMVVRFANGESDVRNWVTTAQPDWGDRRVLYVQHPSDPVAWWSPKMIFSEPDWLREPVPAGYDRAMTWLPIISFLQVSADLPVAANAPMNFGHNYGSSIMPGFAAIAGMQLSDASLSTLEQQLVTLRGDRPK